VRLKKRGSKFIKPPNASPPRKRKQEKKVCGKGKKKGTRKRNNKIDSRATQSGSVNLDDDITRILDYTKGPPHAKSARIPSRLSFMYVCMYTRQRASQPHIHTHTTLPRCPVCTYVCTYVCMYARGKLVPSCTVLLLGSVSWAVTDLLGLVSAAERPCQARQRPQHPWW
jgi:hypothetical protein